MSVNKHIILGRLGSKPELRKTSTGKSVTTLNVATDDSYTDSQGERKQGVDWHRVTVWGRDAENCCLYLDKGSQVYVEGPSKTKEWTDENQQTRYSTEVTALQVKFLSSNTPRPEPASAPTPTQNQPSF